MNIFDFLNVALIMGIIILIQFFKMVVLKKKKIKKQTWYFVVLACGLLCALVITDYVNFNIMILISNMIIYAAASMFFYETGKMGYNKLFIKKNEKKK